MAVATLDYLSARAADALGIPFYLDTWATSAGVIVGAGVRYLLPQTLQLIIGVPAILVAFFSVLWVKGFGPEDRELFRLRKSEVQELREAEARDQVASDIV